MHEHAHTAGSDTGSGEPGSVALFRDSVRGVAQLAMTEASLALTSLPRLIAVGLARIILLCLGIFGMSLVLALALYANSGSSLLAMVAFLVPMAVIVVLLGRYQRVLQRELTLPATRAEVEAFSDLLREACSEKTPTETATANTEHYIAGQA